MLLSRIHPLLQRPLALAATVLALTYAPSGHAQARLTEAEYVEQVLAAGLPARLAAAQAALERAEQQGQGLWANPRLQWQRESAQEAQDFFLLEVPLALSGRLGLEREAASLSSRAAEARLAFARAELQHQARAAFAGAVAARDRRAALQGSVKELQELAQIISARERAGEAAGLERLRIDLEVANVEDTLREAELRQREAELAALGLLGPDAGALPALQPSPIEPLHLQPAQALLAELELRRADLAALELDAQSAERAQRAAARRWIPDPTLVGGAQVLELGRADSQVGYVVGVQVPLPLFERGQQQAALASARRDLAQTRRALLLTTARAKLLAALETAKSRRERLERHRTQTLPRAEQLRRAARAAYQGGGADLLLLVESERAHREAGLRLIDLTLAAAEADSELLLLTGAPGTP